MTSTESTQFNLSHPLAGLTPSRFQRTDDTGPRLHRTQPYSFHQQSHLCLSLQAARSSISLASRITSAPCDPPTGSLHSWHTDRPAATTHGCCSPRVSLQTLLIRSGITAPRLERCTCADISLHHSPQCRITRLRLVQCEKSSFLALLRKSDQTEAKDTSLGWYTGGIMLRVQRQPDVAPVRLHREARCGTSSVRSPWDLEHHSSATTTSRSVASYTNVTLQK